MSETPPPTFRESCRFWWKLGFISFGGPAGQIAIMHTELVERRRWVEERLFLHALNFCMMLPGPEAQQLATYLGWRLHGVKGGIVAGAIFVLPAAVLLWGLSWLYVTMGTVTWVAALFYGLQPAVMAIVLAAVLRIGRKALKNAVMWGVAGAAFVALFVFKAPFLAVMVGAGVLGWAGRWLAPEKFLLNPGAGHGASSAYARADAGAVVDLAENKWPSHGQGWRSLRVVATGLGLWWAPVVAVGLLLGWQSVWTQLGLFFSKAALITFGGAYAVLPYVAEQAVVEHAWLTTPQMMSGLALAETTPGPLIMVLQFVGFIAAWQSPGGMPPLLSATLGAGLTTWVTFLPSFIFVLAGAPYIERLQQVRALTAVLTTVTAAVVGVILNLAVWFGWHTVCPDGRGVDVFAALLALGLFLGLHFRQWGVIPVVMTGGLLGMAWQLLGPG